MGITFDPLLNRLEFTEPSTPMSDASVKSAYENNNNTNEYSDSEKSKLAGLNSSKFLGQFVNLSSLQSAHPSPALGSFANVDSGAGSEVKRYIWDSNGSSYVRQLGESSILTNAQVKSQYESNANTNAYTDTSKGKVDNISITQPVNLDQLETDVSANNSKTGISSAQTTKLSNIETSATADQTDAEIRTAVESASNSNVFNDADHTKLNGIEASATADQTNAEIETAYNNQVAAASLSEVQAGSSTAIKRFTPQRVKQAIEYCLPELTKSIFVSTPIATDDFGIWEPGIAITITKVIVQGIGGTSTTFNINHSGGTDLFSSDKVATTSRQVFTSGDFSDASCTAANYIQYQASAISGTPAGIKITITYTED